MFSDLLEQLKAVKGMEFDAASGVLIDFVDHTKDFQDILMQIETIPESIGHDSTEEKLFSKVSDAVLSRAFREIGLKSTVLKERGDSADVFAESPIHGYTLVADAKAFRMSRTAKNQKDFKVVALSGWRKDYDYSVLCSPYFQYPSKSSQIFAQAVEHNVCLLSWEHLSFLIANGIRETAQVSFSRIWNYTSELAEEIVVAKKKECFIPRLNERILQCADLDKERFEQALKDQISMIGKRAAIEKQYWEDEIKKINGFTREEAIEEVIKAKKIYEKIAQINAYTEGLST